jgi:hypothetical protein
VKILLPREGAGVYTCAHSGPPKWNPGRKTSFVEIEEMAFEEGS